MTITLANLLRPASLEALLAGMADRRMAYDPGACAIPPEILFSGDDLEALLLRDGIDKMLRVSVNGMNIDMERLGVTRNGSLRHLALRKMIRQGASLILIELERHHSPLWAFVCDAERRLLDRVSISAVASFHRIPALRAHYDQADLIVIQVEGIKEWHLLGEPMDCGTAQHPGITAPTEVTANLTMRPGDALFVPAGLHHRCTAEGFSLHIAVWIEHATMRDMILDLFKQHATLHRPLRPVLGVESLVGQVAAIRSELVARLDELDPAAWLADWNARRGRVTRLGLRDSQVEAMDDKIAALSVTMVPGPDSIGAKIGGLQLEPDPDALAILQALAGGPIPVRALIESLGNDVDPDDARHALAQLIDRGLVHLEAGDGSEAAIPSKKVVAETARAPASPERDQPATTG